MSDENPVSVVEDMRKAIKEMLEEKNPVPAGLINGRLNNMTVFKGNLRPEERDRYYKAHVNTLRYVAGALVAWGQEVRIHDERINKITDVAILLNAFGAFVNENVPPPTAHSNINKILEKLQEERFLYDYNVMTTSNILSLSIKKQRTDEHVSWKLTKPQTILWLEYLKHLFVDNWTPQPIEFITTEEMTI
jgi:hypothetical protein